MIEQITNKIIEITGIASNIRLAENGGFSLYPSEAHIAARFIDGGELRSVTFTMQCKGKAPSELFTAAENACSRIKGFNGSLIGDSWEAVLFEVSSPPVFERCESRCEYIVSCCFKVEYLIDNA